MTEFEKITELTLTNLQGALADVLCEYGDPSVLRPVDICEILGIDMNLAWKLSRLVNSTDVFSVGKYLPGRKAMGSFCDRASSSRCPANLVESLQAASDQVEKVIRTYAGSRKELKLMLANLSVEERAGNDLIQRRKSFDGNSYTFGVQSDVQLSSNILIPSRIQSGMADLCRIRGQVGLCRMRTDVPWRLSNTYILDSDGVIKESPEREFLFPVVPGEPPLVREFCSRHLPDFGSITNRAGRSSYFLKGKEIGIKSSINLFTAEVVRGSGIMYRNSPGEAAAMNNTSRTPTKKFVIEVFMPPQFNSSPFVVEMWSRLFGSEDMSEMSPGDLLPLSEQPVLFSAGRSPVPVPGIPDYCKLIRSCFSRLGENPADYRLLRLTVDYPPIPASIDVLLVLPEKPL